MSKEYIYYPGWYYISKNTPIKIHLICNHGKHNITKKEAISIIKFAINDANKYNESTSLLKAMLKHITTGEYNG